MDHVLQIIRTVGAESWEGLKGRTMLTLFKEGDEHGRAVGIASLNGHHVLIFDEHLAEYREEKSTTEAADLSETV